MANMVRQGLSFSRPGFQAGISRTTRSASLFSKGSADCAILMSLTDPSLLMINVTTTLPCIFLC